MNPSVQRTLVRLGTAFALGWATTSMSSGPGSAALVQLTGKLGFAGLFLAIFYLGAAVGAAAGGRAMDRFGRRSVLVAAYCISAVGFVLAGIGVSAEIVFLFIAGVVTYASAFGCINLTRVSAAEMFPPAERGRGVGWIQVCAIFGAVLGPLFILFSKPLASLMGQTPLGVVWFLAPPLLLVAAVVVSGADEPSSFATQLQTPQAGAASTAAQADSHRLVLAASVSLAASQAAMAAVMGVAGAAVTHAGHGVEVLSGVMFMHFVGMFGLSRIVGGIADRFGRRATILSGLTLLALGGLIVAIIPGSLGLGAGLLIVGFGWSFAFIGSTVLLTDVTAPSHRARTMGRADLGAQISSAIVAAGGGWWFATHGLAGLGIAAIAVAAIPLVLLAFVQETEPGKYPGKTAPTS